MTVPVHAQENQKFPTIEDIEIVDDTTVRNIETKEYYIFSSSDERDTFIAELEMQNISLYVCLPGAAGYPTCGNVVVSSELQTMGAATETGLLRFQNYLLGNDGWIFGPGTAIYSTSSGISAQFKYNDNFSLSFSYSVTKGGSFYVDDIYRGNIVFVGNFSLTPQRWVFKLKDGSTTYGAKFYISRLLYGGLQLVTVLK